MIATTGLSTDSVILQGVDLNFAGPTIDSLDALEDQLMTGLKALETSPNMVKSIAGWDWIINCVPNRN